MCARLVPIATVSPQPLVLRRRAMAERGATEPPGRRWSTQAEAAPAWIKMLGAEQTSTEWIEGRFHPFPIPRTASPCSPAKSKSWAWERSVSQGRWESHSRIRDRSPQSDGMHCAAPISFTTVSLDTFRSRAEAVHFDSMGSQSNSGLRSEYQGLGSVPGNCGPTAPVRDPA